VNTVYELLDDYRAGRRRPRDVLQSVYEGIHARKAAPVWISLFPFEEALSALEAAERASERGPLFGVPFGVKDNIDVAGLPTTAACPAFSYRPERSAFVVERLIAAGAIPIGKTNLDQFATGLVGTRTPYGICSSVFDERYISGGSSSGSAVAVARGDVPFALGTDTAGSGRIPAGFNALVGVKPTVGLLSSRGVVPACRSLDCVSIFAKDVRDAALLLETCSSFDPDDAMSRPRPARTPATRLADSVRIGIPTPESLEFFGDSESARLFQSATERMQGHAQLVPVDLAPLREAANLLYFGPWVAERLVATEQLLNDDPGAIEPTVRGILEGARKYSALDAFRGRYRLANLERHARGLWQQMDALLVPTAPTHYRIEEVLADPLRLNTNLGTYTNFVNLLDMCGLAIPAGFRENGLPFGVTLLGPQFHDSTLLELARRFEGQPPAQHTSPPAGHIWLAVAGAHLSGQPLNHELVSRGARLVTRTRTAAEYRLFALATTPPKPGLVHAPGAGSAAAIEVEVWELDERAFGSFVAAIPAPMTIGTTRLHDGGTVKGFSCEPHALEGAREITSFGGWRSYLAELSSS